MAPTAWILNAPAVEVEEIPFVYTAPRPLIRLTPYFNSRYNFGFPEFMQVYD